jgi:hypothetical protein
LRTLEKEVGTEAAARQSLPAPHRATLLHRVIFAPVAELPFVDVPEIRRCVSLRREREREREGSCGGLTRELEAPLPSNSPHDHMILRVELWWAHTGGGNALAFKQPRMRPGGAMTVLNGYRTGLAGVFAATFQRG